MIRRITWLHTIGAYVVSIFAFAAIYTWLRHDFYHSYVKYEPVIRELRSRTQEDVARAIDAQLSGKPDLGNGIQFQLAYALRIQGEQEGVLTGFVQIGATVKRDGHQQLFTTRLPILISALGLQTIEKPNAPRTLIETPEQLRERVHTVYIARDSQRPAQDETMLEHDSYDQTAVTDAIGEALKRIGLSDDQKQGLLVIQNAEQGFPGSAGGTFARMLYFRAITITTVGYGDIVPLTHRGRVLAAVEATLGIVLLGLLVSSLTR